MSKLRNYQYIIFALFGSAVLLGGLVLPGYMLTLDMVFGPIVAPLSVGSLYSILPIVYLRTFLAFLFGGWVAQKLILLGIFFLLFYVVLRFFKEIFKLETTYGVEYLAALVFVINPFVYERMLAGQWLVVAGYMMLVPALVYTLRFIRDHSVRNIYSLAVCLSVLAIVSTHYFAVVMVLVVPILLVRSLFVSNKLTYIKRGLLLGGLLLVCNSYWLVPAVLNQKETQLATFTPDHYEVFKTVSDEKLGTVGNIFMMHGFWLEREPWIERFLVAKEQGWQFVVTFAALMIFVVVGVYGAMRNRDIRLQVIVMTLVVCLAVVFSAGIGQGVFSGFNAWLFDNVSFWKGFRDTQKWSGVLMAFYALFAGYGLLYVLERARVSYRRSLLWLSLCVPVLMTPMMLFGFAGQLQTVQYPSEWREVNMMIKTDPDCKVLFLPWHQYYALKFNNGMLTGNVASSFFECTVVSGKNMELGSIDSQGGHGEVYDRIEELVMNNTGDITKTVSEFKKEGIKYIIFTDDVQLEDKYEYPFLQSEQLELIYEEKGVYLYRLP